MDKYAYHAKSKQYSQDTWYHVSWNYIIKALSEEKRTCTDAKSDSSTWCISMRQITYNQTYGEKWKRKYRRWKEK